MLKISARGGGPSSQVEAGLDSLQDSENLVLERVELFEIEGLIHGTAGGPGFFRGVPDGGAAANRRENQNRADGSGSESGSARRASPRGSRESPDGGRSP